MVRYCNKSFISNVSVIHLNVARVMQTTNDGEVAKYVAMSRVILAFHMLNRIAYHYYHSGAKNRHRGFIYGLRAASEALHAAHFSLAIHYLHIAIRVAKPKQRDIDQFLKALETVKATITQVEWSVHTEKRLQQLHKLREIAHGKLEAPKWGVMSFFKNRGNKSVVP